MIIALDYDDTYTEDALFFNKLIKSAQEHGHYVFIVTARMANNIEDIKSVLPAMEIVATSGTPKRQYLLDNGYPEPSVWIDDMPHII